MKWQSLFSEINKKNIVNLSSAVNFVLCAKPEPLPLSGHF